MSPDKIITNNGVLKFFSTSSIVNIVLFIFFAMFMVILWTSFRERKFNTKTSKELSDTIAQLAKAIVENTTTDHEKDKKYIEEFNILNSNVSKLETSIQSVRREIIKQSTWCMAKSSKNGGEE